MFSGKYRYYHYDVFDEPVISIGETSSFSLGETAGIWQGGDTLENLASGGAVSVDWNAEGDALTISIPGLWPWLNRDLGGGEILIATLNLSNIEGASGTTETISQTMTLFTTARTSSLGWINCEFDNFAFITQGNDLLSPGGSWTLKQLRDLPGPLPDGLHQAGPVYEFEYLGSVVSNYWLQLRPSTKDGLPMSEFGGGIYSWNGSQWEIQRQGFGLNWTWTEPMTETHQILVLLTEWDRPVMPEITSIHPSIQGGHVSPDTPIVITINSESGIREEFADISINGARTLFYDPATASLSGWTMEETDETTTLTYTPPVNWQAGQLVYGSYYIPSNYGLLAAQGEFTFAVEYTDTTDSDSDGMHDEWENANGTDAGTDDRDADPDGDTFSNWTEFTFASNPSSSISLPAFPDIKLYGNQEAYYSGDNMICKARVTNGPVALPVDLYIVLEVMGAYYAWPAFTPDIVPLSFTMPANIDVSFDLFEYDWEDTPDNLSLTWYGAFLEQGTMNLYNLDSLTVLLDK